MVKEHERFIKGVEAIEDFVGKLGFKIKKTKIGLLFEYPEGISKEKKEEMQKAYDADIFKNMPISEYEWNNQESLIGFIRKLLKDFN